jgi:hypothetical protein
VQWVPGSFVGVERPGCEIDRSPRLRMREGESTPKRVGGWEKEHLLIRRCPASPARPSARNSIKLIVCGKKRLKL